MKAVEKKVTELYGEMERDPFYARFLGGTLSREEYAYFLVQSYFYVKLAPDFYTWALDAMSRQPRPHYAPFAAIYERHRREEVGHEKWILADLKALGFDGEALIRKIGPNPAMEGYISFTRFVATGRTPLSLLGADFFSENLVLVYGQHLVESLAAGKIPEIQNAIRFIVGHSHDDIEHVKMIRGAIAAIPDADEKRDTIRAAEATGWLYASIPQYYAGV